MDLKFKARIFSTDTAVKCHKISAFQAKVYHFVTYIPEVAKYLGSKSGQAIGQALCKNIFAVIASDKSIGGFCGIKDPKSTTVQKKKELLEKEGVTFKNENYYLEDESKILSSIPV